MRAPNPESLMNREVNKRLRPIRDRIGTWRAESTYLRALAEKMAASGRPNMAVLTKAKRLLEVVSEVEAAYRDEMARLPEDMARNSRFSDPEVALRQISGELSQIIETLKPQEARRSSL